jgi:hypothetical protein
VSTDAQDAAPIAGPSVLNAGEPDPAPKPATPESYSFKLPEGYTLDPSVADKASALFKDAGLSNEQAQKLVDTYIDLNKRTVESLYSEFNATRTKWATESTAWLEANGGTSAVKADIGRALNSIFQKDGAPDSAAIAGFREAMDMTGAGSNPYFIRAFATLAKAYTEGTPVNGNGPSQFGQRAPNSRTMSPAEAFYGPNGPRTNPFVPPNQPQSG